MTGPPSAGCTWLSRRDALPCWPRCCNGLPRRICGGAGAAWHGASIASIAFAPAVAEIFAPPETFLELITPDTPVCRCENVTLAELETCAAEGATGMVQLKSTTRLSMGRCQGRFCLATLADLVAARRGIKVADLDWPRIRPPARPVRLGDLLHETVPPPALPDDPHLPRGS